MANASLCIAVTNRVVSTTSAAPVCRTIDPRCSTLLCLLETVPDTQRNLEGIVPAHVERFEAPIELHPNGPMRRQVEGPQTDDRRTASVEFPAEAGETGHDVSDATPTNLAGGNTNRPRRGTLRCFA